MEVTNLCDTLSLFLDSNILGFISHFQRNAIFVLRRVEGVHEMP